MEKLELPKFRKVFTVGYTIGGMYDLRYELIGRGRTPAEAIKDLKENFIKQCIKESVELTKYTDLLSAEDFFFTKVTTKKEFIAENCSLRCEWREYEHLENGYDKELGSGNWSPKYEIKLGV